MPFPVFLQIFSINKYKGKCLENAVLLGSYSVFKLQLS